ncbi:MAG: outer membrane protein assembly factor BamD [Oligoflexia bacterium]|nr:outer membrane protein assembly factor BamD [Oligoflexia bacterium]
MHTAVKLGIVSALIALLAGCSGSAKPEPEIKELGVPDKSKLIDAPELSLLEDAKRLYSERLFSVAQDSFESLRTNYPLSPYVEFAEIKIADCHFQALEYPEAAQAYEDFAKTHPVSEAVPYALFMAGRSQQLQQRGVGRDAATLEKAIGFFDRMIKEYPDSALLADAKKYKLKAQKSLAAYERFVIDFYRRKSSPEAVKAREEAYRIKWDGILKQPESSNAAAPALAEVAQSDYNVAADQPHAPKMIALAVAPEERSPQAKLAALEAMAMMRQDNITLPGPATALHDLVQNVECVAGQQKQIYLFLNEPLSDEAFVKANAQIEPKNGQLALHLPGTVGREIRKDCFGASDLQISTAGTLTLRSESQAQLIALKNPDRLLLALVSHP